MAIPAMTERLTRENPHGVVGKALTAASSFLVPAYHTRRPYLPVQDDLVARFRQIAEEDFADLCWCG